MKADLTFEIVIDKSGSMSGDKIANARTAAKLLVDLAQEGATKIGVIAFDSSPRTIRAITDITDQSAKNSVKASIDQISAGGGTAIGAAAQSALNSLLGQSGAGNRVVFLLSDGLSGDNALAPIPAYVAAQIPIFSFSYGGNADTVVLGQMASATKGKLFVSPTSLASVSQAFQDANAAASAAQNVAAGSNTASPGVATRIPIAVDSSISRLTLTVTHSGAPSLASYELIAPNAARFGPTRVDVSAGETLSFFSIEGPAAGRWDLEAMGNGGDVPFTFQASANPDGNTFVLASDLFSGPSLSYPEPMIIVATLTKELPIANASVTATITKPDSSTTMLTLADDGSGPDGLANDGQYAAVFGYTMPGLHIIEVRAAGEAGIAVQTSNGLESSAPPAPENEAPTPDVPILESFERFERFQVNAIGVVTDDHGDTRALATAIAADNSTATAGKIEEFGDIDMFSVLVPLEASEVVVRLGSTALGMDPVVRVLAADGTVLAEGTFDNAASASGYVAIPVAAAPGTPLFVEVTHVSSDGTGLYAVSAGTRVVFDEPADSDGDGVNDDDGDGVNDEQDLCIDSELSQIVVIDGCDTGVPNLLDAQGCTIADEIALMRSAARNHGGYVREVSHLGNQLKEAGEIDRSTMGRLTSCAANPM
ncbi:MAG: VWA domain-containing protein [Myxococcota bacterium]|nr:VWA domain-containing protein [Myxococcota bacterium]